MAAFERILALFALLLAFCPYLTQAAPAASTFYLEKTETQFSLNIANDSNTDVFIYFTSPAYSWVGVGFGDGMQDSLMFIMYPSSDGNNVTVSPRIARGHSEPSVARDVQLEILPGTGVKDEMFVLKAVCKNCRVWAGGFLDVKDTAYPMIYAFGPGNRLQSNSLNAPLRRHVRYGKFTMNLDAAVGEGGVPAPASQLNGVVFEGGMKRDHDRANLAHAVMGCLGLFVFWPLNVIFAGFFKKIKIHIGVSIFTMVFLVASYALGISTSSEFNRSKSFTSPHHILAFLSILPILLISILPIRPITQLSPQIPRLHIPLTTLTFTLLVLTGGLGLRLSSQSTPIILSYTAVSLLVFIFIVILTTCIRRRGSAYSRANGRQRVVEEDEQDLVLAAYYANRKLQDDSRTNSAASLERPGASHGRSASGNAGIYGGGSMPGPQYLLNMHPGVPVHRW